MSTLGAFVILKASLSLYIYIDLVLTSVKIYNAPLNSHIVLYTGHYHPTAIYILELWKLWLREAEGLTHLTTDS